MVQFQPRVKQKVVNDLKEILKVSMTSMLTSVIVIAMLTCTEHYNVDISHRGAITENKRIIDEPF